MQRYYKILVILSLVLTIFSCKQKNKYDVDVSDISVGVNIERFDKEIYKLDKANFKDQLSEIQKKYPDVFEVYVQQIAKAGLISDTHYIASLKTFFMDPYSQELYQAVDSQFQDIGWIEEDITEAFKHYKYYFPEDTVPEVYALVTNFGFGAATYENKLFISLDLFLGSDYQYYPSLFPQYMIDYFEPEYIVSESMKAYFGDLFYDDKYIGDNLLEQMLYAGKRLFFLDLMIPDIHDSIKIRYSEADMKWCKKFEGEIWSQFVENKVIYETNHLEINRYLDDGPFTNAYGIPQDSPPRLGEWIGWLIIRSYVDNVNQDQVTDVFFETDAQMILSKSKYKPKL